jgi:hypothetical protein
MKREIKVIIFVLFLLNAVFLMINYEYGKIDSVIRYDPSFINFIENKRLEIEYVNKPYHADEKLEMNITLTNTDKLLIKSPFFRVLIIHPKEDQWVATENYNSSNNKTLLFMGQLKDKATIDFKQGNGTYSLKVIVYQKKYDHKDDEWYEMKELKVIVE